MSALFYFKNVLVSAPIGYLLLLINRF
jgi:hypothetical protein